jgi:general transcription factor 3C protein 4
MYLFDATANDLPFVMRMVVQSLLPGSPADLSAEGNYLSTIAQRALPVPAVNTFNELCPACRVEVPLQDITTAACANGHTWGTSSH